MMCMHQIATKTLRVKVSPLRNEIRIYHERETVQCTFTLKWCISMKTAIRIQIHSQAATYSSYYEKNSLHF